MDLTENNAKVRAYRVLQETSKTIPKGISIMEERKINIDRKPLTSEEIASRRDFDSVLSGSKVFSKPPFYKTGWFTIGIAVIAVTVTTTVASLIIDGDEQNDQLAENSQTNSAPLIEDDFDYTDDTPCINPPLKELDVEYSELLCEC